MFPRNPSFICRRCGHVYSLDESNIPSIMAQSRFECPNCRYEVTNSGICGFFKFYPRLVESEKQLRNNGIKLIGYSFKDITGFGVYILLIKGKMKFECGECKHIWEIDSDVDTTNYRNKPRNFKCPHCYFLSRPISITKEFFVSLNQVNDSVCKFSHMQWNIFSPIGINPPIKNIQSKIYQSNSYYGSFYKLQ